MIAQIHAALAQSIVLFFLVCAVWAFVLHFRGQPLSSSFWGTVFLGEALFVAQIVLGIVMIAGGRTPTQFVHLLYGIVGTLVLPAAYGYLPRYRGRQALVLGVICLFLFGVATRATGTGR